MIVISDKCIVGPNGLGLSVDYSSELMFNKKVDGTVARVVHCDKYNVYLH